MKNNARGYTLMELIVAVGLFALVMSLAAGAYLLIIGMNAQTQGLATGINNLSFALDTMTRNIRTGTNYTCPGNGNSCDLTSGTFTVTNSNVAANATYAYTLSGGAITENGVQLTDPSLVTISTLRFIVGNTLRTPTDYQQATVTMIIAGTVAVGGGKPAIPFAIQTGATMRVPDI